MTRVTHTPGIKSATNLNNIHIDFSIPFNFLNVGLASIHCFLDP